MDILLAENEPFPADRPYVEQYAYYHQMGGHLLRAELHFEKEGRDFTLRRTEVTLCADGRRIYPKQTETGSMTYRNGKLSGDSPEVITLGYPEAREQVYALMGLDWLRDIPDSPLRESAFLQEVLPSLLNGSVYSQETLVRAIARILYGVKRVDWRVWRDYLLITNHPDDEDDDNAAGLLAIDDLRDFTKNITISMKRFIDGDQVTRNLMSDMLAMAADEDRPVDFSWRWKRMLHEHMMQIDRQQWNVEEDKLDRTPIYLSDVRKALNTDTVSLLDSEMSVYKEALQMHHCLYMCYWCSICEDDYVAFHMSAPEPCTFGVSRSGNNPVLDQIYLACDRDVQPATRTLAEQFVAEHADALMQIFRQSYAYKVTSQEEAFRLTLDPQLELDFGPDLQNNSDLPF